MLELKNSLTAHHRGLVAALAVFSALPGCGLLWMPELMVVRLYFQAHEVAAIQRGAAGALLFLSFFTLVILRLETARQKHRAHLVFGLVWFGFLLISLIESNFGYLELSGLFWVLGGAAGLSHLLLAISVKN